MPDKPTETNGKILFMIRGIMHQNDKEMDKIDNLTERMAAIETKLDGLPCHDNSILISENRDFRIRVLAVTSVISFCVSLIVALGITQLV